MDVDLSNEDTRLLGDLYELLDKAKSQINIYFPKQSNTNMQLCRQFLLKEIDIVCVGVHKLESHFKNSEQ